MLRQGNSSTKRCGDDQDPISIIVSNVARGKGDHEPRSIPGLLLDECLQRPWPPKKTPRVYRMHKISVVRRRQRQNFCDVIAVDVVVVFRHLLWALGFRIFFYVLCHWRLGLGEALDSFRTSFYGLCHGIQTVQLCTVCAVKKMQLFSS